ncbi:hypothetical protein BN946_scf184575.g5 [Trametes cinnabarina]|uniref:Histone H1 n=1 Tax=Pycnoporus cinnabarinus TaxID=5643 RepID=A0A060S4X4_PYCCI|nr:hypothetical protein BN946_scf184575.g5 [Trametes cinnabarina]
MSATKKASAKSAASKKSAPRAPAAHPSWIDMIKVGAYDPVAHTVAVKWRTGARGRARWARLTLWAKREVGSLPAVPFVLYSLYALQRYVEDKYGLDIGAAQVSQLSKAINHGAEKGILVLPKGPSGRVKLPPKSQRPADASATKENKPDAKPVKTKALAKSTTAGKTAAPKKAPATKKAPAAKPVAAKKAAPTKTAAKSSTTTKAKAVPAKKAAAPAVKKAPVKKAVAPVKKSATASKRDSAKKSVTGKTPAGRKATTRASGTKSTSRAAKAAKKS